MRINRRATAGAVIVVSCFALLLGISPTAHIAPSVNRTQPFQLSSPGTDQSICTALNVSGAPYPANATLIWSRLCELPGFVIQVAMWGDWVPHYSGNGSPPVWVLRNLTFGWGGKIGQPPTLVFTISWIASCNNASIAPKIWSCSDQEWWIGNVTTNTIGGPFFYEGPIICMETTCGRDTGHQSILVVSNGTPLPVTLVLGTGAAVGAAAAGIILANRGRPFRPDALH